MGKSLLTFIAVVSVVILFWIIGSVWFNETGGDKNSVTSTPHQDRFPTQTLNVMSGPSVEDEIISVLQAGERIQVLDESNGWLHIRTVENNKEGWVLRINTNPISGLAYWKRQQGGHVSSQWRTSSSKDAMTGKQSSYANSLKTTATERMSFPYSDTEAWLGVGCDDQSEWVYVGFSESPNLLNTDIEDGYNRIRTRVRWDNEIENVTLTQEWGAAFLHFSNDTDIISKIVASNTALLELNWYGSGSTYFQFSLIGSSSVITDIRNTCSTY